MNRLLIITLLWCHNEREGVSNHRRLNYLLNRLFRRGSKKTSKLRVTGLYEGNPSVTGGFPSEKASNAERISIWWRHHDLCLLRFRRARLRADVLWSPETSYLYDLPQYEHSTNTVTPWWYVVDLLGHFLWIETPRAPGKSSATGWPSLEFFVYTASVGHRVILLTCRRHSCRIAFLLPRWWGGSCRHCAMCHDERPRRER